MGQHQSVARSGQTAITSTEGLYHETDRQHWCRELILRTVTIKFQGGSVAELLMATAKAIGVDRARFAVLFDEVIVDEEPMNRHVTVPSDSKVVDLIIPTI